MTERAETERAETERAETERAETERAETERAGDYRVDYIERTREQYSALGYPPYQWVTSSADAALHTPTKPLTDCRVALIASGGIYRQGQIAFHFKDDFSYRLIDRETPQDALRATHFAYDLTDARRDPGVVFPLRALRTAERRGEVGRLHDQALTFMGGIYSARKVRDVLATAMRKRLVRDEVDVALLVPV